MPGYHEYCLGKKAETVPCSIPNSEAAQSEIILSNQIDFKHKNIQKRKTAQQQSFFYYLSTKKLVNLYQNYIFARLLKRRFRNILVKKLKYF